MNTTTAPWIPATEEVRRIVADLRPVFDECVARSRRLLGGAAADAAEVAAPARQTAA